MCEQDTVSCKQIGNQCSQFLKYSLARKRLEGVYLLLRNCYTGIRALFRSHKSLAQSVILRLTRGFICTGDNKGGWSPIKGKPPGIHSRIKCFTLIRFRKRRTDRPTNPFPCILLRKTRTTKFGVKFPMAPCAHCVRWSRSRASKSLDQVNCLVITAELGSTLYRCYFKSNYGFAGLENCSNMCGC